MGMPRPVRRPNAIIARLCYRAYRFSMWFEAMSALALRRALMNVMLGRRHQRLNIFSDVYIDGCDGLSLGDDVSINRGSHLSCVGGVAIGDFVSIGHGTSILSTEHGYADTTVPIKYQPVITAPVKIGSNVWIGAKVTILAGVSIADGTVIAAGAVVTKSVAEPDTIIGGVPARKLKDRLSSTS